MLDVVIPVYNEQAALGACVRRVHAHLVETFPYPFRITVADNASTDATWQVALALVEELPGVAAVHLDAKGRGRALRQVWLASDALILAYMDVDLSTDLDALWPLLAPLMSGHSDVSIGTRLHRSSRTVRGPKRELISRAYNLILRGALGVGFSDAQCGFKAIRADVAAELLPIVEDNTWFFDTELLVLAERSDLRIHEVPVDWWDDPDSRVDVVGTARDDLRGVWRLHRALASGRLPVAQIGEAMGRRMPSLSMPVGRQAVIFLVIGVLSMALQLALFAALRGGLPELSSQVANLVALVTSTVVNTAANRRWAFGVRGREGALRHQLQGLGLLGMTLAFTGLGLVLLTWLVPAAPTWSQTVVVGAGTAMATFAKFVLMRHWVFVRPPRGLDRPGGEVGVESVTLAGREAA